MFPNLFKLANLAVLTALCATSSPASAQEERYLSLEQTRAYHAGRPSPGALSIAMLLDHADAVYGVGETLRLAVRSNEDAYVTVLSVGTSGRVIQLFPNNYQSDNRIRAGEVLEIPSEASESRIKVKGPVGTELIKVIATSKPVAIIPQAHFEPGGGLFRSLTDGADGLDRDLEVVSAKQPKEVKIAIVHQMIRTVPARVTGAEAGSGGLVIPTAGVLVAIPPVAVASGQTFPLLLAVDKQVYRTGEPITMAVTSLRSCYLTVIGVDNDGRTRRIFPSLALPSPQISGLQTVMLSGGPSPQTIVAGKYGTETIKAFCTNEPQAASLPVRAATEELGDDERSALDRDLAVVPSSPAGTAGYAEVNFGITR